MYSEGPMDERSARARARAIERELRHAELDRIRAFKHAIKHDVAKAVEGLGNIECFEGAGKSAPRSVDNILTEIDSYISYLEDLPKEKVTPYEEKLGGIEEHLKKLRGTLTK